MGGRGSSGTGKTVSFQNIDEIISYFGVESGKWREWFNGLSRDQRQGITQYTSMDYRAINRYLRTGDLKGYPPKDMERYIKGADEALAKAELKNDIIVYRGIGPSMFGGFRTADEINEIFAGHTVTDPGYGSASPLQGSAYNKQYRLDIKVPRGKGHGAWVDPISAYSGENEFMLPRGTTYKILGARKEGGKIIVEAEIVKKRGRK